MLAKLLDWLKAIQLLIAIFVFVVYGWHQQQVDADLRSKDMDYRKAEIEVLTQAVLSLKKSDSYLVGNEILKIVFSPDQKCFTADQYVLVEFMADIYAKVSDVPSPKEKFLQLARHRPGCPRIGAR